MSTRSLTLLTPLSYVFMVILFNFISIISGCSHSLTCCMHYFFISLVAFYLCFLLGCTIVILLFTYLYFCSTLSHIVLSEKLFIFFFHIEGSHALNMSDAVCKAELSYNLTRLKPHLLPRLVSPRRAFIQLVSFSLSHV